MTSPEAPPPTIERVGTAALSVVLATDTFETIRPVVERLRRQTAADRLEIIFVIPDRAAFDAAAEPLPEFGRVAVIAVPSLDVLAAAQVVGVRAATAPLVFIGETHSYPHPGWAQALLERAAAGPWTVVVPAFGNANPKGALSWAGFLGDYGAWTAGLPAQEVVGVVPMYNALYRRSFLLELGDRLETAISHGDEMLLALRGHRAYFEPTARIDHVNITRPGAWLRERFLCGVLVGTVRARRWSWWRRLAYTCGAPLIPLVLLARTRGGVQVTAREKRLPPGTRLAMVVGAVAKAAGECVGYAWGSGADAERQMTEYEVHKLTYTGDVR